MCKIEDIPKLKEKFNKNNLEPENISLHSYIKAKANVDTMFILNEQDAFLFYASLNLLNAYVKQNKTKISYGFKEYVKTGFDAIIMNKIDATYFYDNTEKVLIVNIKGLQFSFHNVEPSAKMYFAKNFEDKLNIKHYKPQEWEGLRLQPVAETLFKYANGLHGLSNQCLVGDLKEYQDECVREQLKKSI